MNLKRLNQPVMSYIPLYSLVLYTLNDDKTGEATTALLNMLCDLGYVNEGDQSTVMLTGKSKQIGGIAFLEKLNALSKEVKFHNGDVVTLINAGYHTDANGKAIRDRQDDLIPVMRRFRFEFTDKQFMRKEREELR